MKTPCTPILGHELFDDPDINPDDQKKSFRIQDRHSENMFMSLLNTLIHSYNQAACEHQVKGDLMKSNYYKGKADAFAASARHYAEMVNENCT